MQRKSSDPLSSQTSNSKVCSRSILQCLGSRLYVTHVKHRSPVKEAMLTLLNSKSRGFTFCKRLWPAAYRCRQCFIRGFSQHLPIQPLHDQKILSFGRDIKENLHLYLIRKCLVKYLQWQLQKETPGTPFFSFYSTSQEVTLKVTKLYAYSKGTSKCGFSESL